MRPYRRTIACFFIGLASCIGCSKEQVEQAMNQVSEQVKEQVKEQVQQQKEAIAPIAPAIVSVGSISINLKRDVQFPTCNCVLLRFSDGRPSVLQIKSYITNPFEKFPSFFFQGTVQANSIQELAGKSISGEIHVALDDQGDMWQSEPASTAKITVTGIEGSELVGTIPVTPMVNPEGKKSTCVGMFRAVTESQLGSL